MRTAKQQIRFDGDSYEYASSTVYDCDREYLESVSDGNNDVRKKGDYDKLVKKEFNQDYVDKFFDIKVINKLIDDHYNNKANNGRKIYNIYIFLIWYKVYFVNGSY